MVEYFASLSALEKVYLACAVFGGSLFVLRMILMLCGADSSDADTDMDFDAHDVDFDADGADVDAAHGADADHAADAHEIHADGGLRLLTFQGLTAFAMMFGLAGFSISRSSGLGSVVTLGIGILAGMLGMWVLAKGFAIMRSLQSSGTMSLYDAVGEEGSVYLTIPPGGTGKVRVAVSGRLQVIDAVSSEDEELKTGDRVVVTKVSQASVLAVKKA